MGLRGLRGGTHPSLQAMSMKNTLRTQLCRIACGNFKRPGKSFITPLHQISGVPLDAKLWVNGCPHSFLQGNCGKTFPLPILSLMWHTDSLLAPLKAEEMNVSVCDPKKTNMPSTFVFLVSLWLQTSRRQRQTGSSGSQFSKPAAQSRAQVSPWQEHLQRYLPWARGSKLTQKENLHKCDRRSQPPIL